MRIYSTEVTPNERTDGRTKHRESREQAVHKYTVPRLGAGTSSRPESPVHIIHYLHWPVVRIVVIVAS